MASQIETLNTAVTDLQAANDALVTRVAALEPATDLAPAIAAIQGVTSSLNTLLPTPATPPTTPAV